MSNRRMSYVAVGVTAAAIAVFLAAPLGSLVQVAAWSVPYVLAVGVLAVRVKGAPASARVPLQILLAGCVVYVAASVVWYVGPVRLGLELPFPSPLDAAFFASYGLYGAFLCSVLRRRSDGGRVEGRIALADALILTASLSAVLCVTVIEPNLTNGTSALASAVAVLYPAFLLVLFALAARLAVGGGAALRGPEWFLLLWIGAELVADVFYGIQSANGTFTYGSPLMTAWMLAYGVLAALAVHPGFVVLLAQGSGGRGASERQVGVRRHTRPAVLLGAALVPVALAVWHSEHAVALLATTAATFALVTYRSALVGADLHEQRTLVGRLDEVLREVTARRDSLARVAAVVESTDDSVITTSPDGVITGWNGGAERLYGYASAEALGRHVSMIIPPDGLETFASVMATLAEQGSVRIESKDVRKDGSRVPTSITISNVYDDTATPVGVVAIARDMSERLRAEQQAREAARQLEAQAEELARLAFHDPLTGLGNRTAYRDVLTDLTELAGPGGREFAVIVLDLDDFKVVNDSLGHAAGDALLVAAAERLRRVVGNKGSVFRLGGDEFAVLVRAAGEAAAVELGERILAEFYRDFVVVGHALRTTASVGIGVGDPGADEADLLRSADLAMYAAKAAGKGKLAVYRSEMLVQAQQRLDLENHLRHAIERGEMHLAYQPMLDAASGELHGLEALLRWQHPAWGAVSPATFIPIAERSGTILALGEWVLRTACRDAFELAQERGTPVRMSVNVSVRQLQVPAFVSLVRAVLDGSGLDPALLTLEVTESLLIEEDHRSTAVLREVHALGVHLSIDDFGTGHSSLARLRTLPVAELKIDRSFISEISDGECGPIVTAVVAMARALGLSVVAEGVETHGQLDALRRLACDVIQGYVVSRPVPRAELDLTVGRPSQPLPWWTTSP